MKRKKDAAPAVESPGKSDTKFLAPCVVAALVWLALALYMLIVVPAQLDVHAQAAKPDSMRAALPAALKFALFLHEWYGTAPIALLGLGGCGIAYVRRSEKWANRMILFGAACLCALVWVVLSSLPKH